MLANIVMSIILIKHRTMDIPQNTGHHKVDLWHGHKFSLVCFHKAYENCKSFCKKVGIQVAVNDIFCRLNLSLVQLFIRLYNY